MEMLASESGVDWMSLDLDQVIDTFFASGILVALLVPLPKCAERLIGDSGMTTRNISLAALTMDSLQSIFPAYTDGVDVPVGRPLYIRVRHMGCRSS